MMYDVEGGRKEERGMEGRERNERHPDSQGLKPTTLKVTAYCLIQCAMLV